MPEARARAGQVINLGVHMLDPAFPHAVLLMEVMPSLLARREFPPPDTLQTLEPGFRDSPDPGRDLAIVFLRVRPRARPGAARPQADRPLPCNGGVCNGLRVLLPSAAPERSPPWLQTGTLRPDAWSLPT